MIGHRLGWAFVVAAMAFFIVSAFPAAPLPALEFANGVVPSPLNTVAEQGAAHGTAATAQSRRSVAAG